MKNFKEFLNEVKDASKTYTESQVIELMKSSWYEGWNITRNDYNSETDELPNIQRDEDIKMLIGGK